MHTLFLAISIIIAIASPIPYIVDIYKGRTKPNLVSWITWTLLTGIAAAALIAAKEYTAAIFTGSVALATSLVVVIGLLKRAYVLYSTFDIVCQIGAIVGVILWQLFNSPLISVLACVLIDFIGALPTLRHAWQKPREETLVTFALGAISSMFGLLALHIYHAINLPYPIYLIAINLAIVFVIVYRRKLTLNLSTESD